MGMPAGGTNVAGTALIAGIRTVAATGSAATTAARTIVLGRPRFAAMTITGARRSAPGTSGIGARTSAAMTTAAVSKPARGTIVGGSPKLPGLVRPATATAAASMMVRNHGPGRARAQR